MVRLQGLECSFVSREGLLYAYSERSLFAFTEEPSYPQQGSPFQNNILSLRTGAGRDPLWRVLALVLTAMNGMAFTRTKNIHTYKPLTLRFIQPAHLGT